MSVIETRGGVDPDLKKFDKLDSDWRDAVANSSPEEIRRRMADIATSEELNQQRKKADPELNQLQDKLSELLEPYKEDSKGAKLRLKYCVKVLQDKGAL